MLRYGSQNKEYNFVPDGLSNCCICYEALRRDDITIYNTGCACTASGKEYNIHTGCFLEICKKSTPKGRLPHCSACPKDILSVMVDGRTFFSNNGGKLQAGL